MGKNIDKRKNPCIFIDLDGTIVKHNYDPEHTMDVFIMNTVVALQQYQEKGYELCLLTARSQEHTESVVVDLLETFNINFGAIICDLSAGKRILINDYKNSNELTAYAFNFPRDKGMTSIECEKEYE